MRDIKFRGKRVDNREWAHGWYREFFNSSDGKTHSIISDDYTKAYEVIPETVGQFTGLLDKNGKEIFEGDIVHYLYQPGKGHFNCDEVGSIEWKTTGFYLNSRFRAWLVSVPGASSPELWEVTGNIHTNPELLKEVD